MLPLDETSCRNRDDDRVRENKKDMPERKLPQIESNGLGNDQSGDNILDRSSWTCGSGESRNGSPEESHNECVDKAVRLDECVRSTVIPVDDIPVVKRPDHYAGQSHQNAKREENPIRIRGATVWLRRPPHSGHVAPP